MPHPRFDTLVEKIREKRKHTPWREFVMEIASWCPLTMYRHGENISRYPLSDRTGTLVEPALFLDQCDDERQWRKWDAARSLFDQVADLWKETPLPRLWHFLPTENCDYCDTVGAAKNCYLTICAGFDVENVLYSFHVTGSRNVFNSTVVSNQCDHIYQSSGIDNSYEVFYSRYISGSRNIWFSTNLQWCHDCIFCNNLENQCFMINNVSYTPEEYAKKKSELLDRKTEFMHWYKKMPYESVNIGSKEVTGRSILRSESVTQSMFIADMRNGRNVLFAGGHWPMEEVFDTVSSATADYVYGSMGYGPWDHAYGCLNSGSSHEMYYCNYCFDCDHCFGCVGLRHKSYCILNTEYSREEWYSIVTEILEGMEKGGVLWDFFPATMNPFYFNDTVAAMVSDITREEVVGKGFLWREWEQKTDIPEWIKTHLITEVNLTDISDSVLGKVFVDANGNAWKITTMELAFLRQYALPLPERHFLERLKVNLSAV